MLTSLSFLSSKLQKLSPGNEIPGLNLNLSKATNPEDQRIFINVLILKTFKLNKVVAASQQLCKYKVLGLTPEASNPALSAQQVMGFLSPQSHFCFLLWGKLWTWRRTLFSLSFPVSLNNPTQPAQKHKPFLFEFFTPVTRQLAPLQQLCCFTSSQAAAERSEGRFIVSSAAFSLFFCSFQEYPLTLLSENGLLQEFGFLPRL